MRLVQTRTNIKVGSAERRAVAAPEVGGAPSGQPPGGLASRGFSSDCSGMSEAGTVPVV
jgi:hypothetical protein